MPSPVCHNCKENPAGIQVQDEKTQKIILLCFGCFDKTHKKVTPEEAKRLKR